MLNKTFPEGAAWLGLTGRVCVVTGAASGIGAQTARHFAAAGAAVAILDRDAEGAAKVASEIELSGGRALSIVADVSSRESIGAAACEVQRKLGPCEVLVNNAAILHSSPLMTMDLDRWSQALAVNLTGVLVCAQAFGGQMIAGQRGGSIINVGSIMGDFPRANGGAYSTAKAGLSMLSRQLAVELGEHRVRINVVSPAFVRTPLSESIYNNPEVAQKRVAMVPSGRIGGMQDIADAILFMASERSSYINGHTLMVDGGLSHMLMAMVPRPQ